MTILTHILLIAGMMSVDGKPVADQELMLIDAVADTIVAVAETDDAGRYAMEVVAPADGKALKLLAKFRWEDIATVEVMDVPADTGVQSCNFDLKSSELITVSGEVEAKRMKPMEFSLAIDLIKVEGFPPELHLFLPLVGKMARTVWYYQPNIRSDHF